MIAAKVMDIISRLPGCDGQAADAVSACTQVKMEDASNLFKIPKNRSVQTFGFVYHDTNGQHHGPVWKTQSFLLYGICTVILWQDYYGKGNFRKSFWNKVGRKFQIGNVSLCIVNKDYSYPCMWDDMKIGWKETKNWSDVESTQQRSWFGRTNIFPWYVYLGCTERQCEISKDTVDNDRTMFESRISAVLLTLRIFVFLHGRMTWWVMQRSVWSDIVSWRTRRLNNSTKYLLHAPMTTTLKKKKWNFLENCHKFALKLF